MKKYIGYLLVFALSLTAISCNDDKIEDQSIFDTEAPTRNEFDKWLMKNYVTPYNIEININGKT